MPEPTPEQERMNRVRDLLIEAVELHKAGCDTPVGYCRQPIPMLAWLCHAVGIHSENMEELGRWCDEADRHCKDFRHGQICRN